MRSPRPDRAGRAPVELGRRSLLFALACACACAALQPVANARSSTLKLLAAEVSLRPPPGLRSRSLRYPWDGQLLKGTRVRESDYVRYVGEYAANGRFFGTWELVQLIERAARRVAFRLPGAKLSIGELSRSGGGHIDGHRSHTSGRDVDIGFYVTLADGTPHYTYAFANFDWRGHGAAPNQYLRFDDGRNWELVAKLLADGDARVQYIFVAAHIKQRLIAEAQRRGAARSVIERAKAALVQPAHGHPHRNHFHVRIYCAPADRAICHDRAPFWPWYPGRPPEGLFTPLQGAPLPDDES